MKLLNLDLIAFGPFTDVNLNLSGGLEGLHLIYGLNEAGKSAALRALRSLFYGIPERTSDNFLHDNSKLRIGATVRHSDGSELSFVRRKGRKATLLDPNEQPLDDSSLRKYLSGVAEEVFATMFGIDHEALLSGGRELLAGKGEVAHSLYAAALGTGNLREVMKELDDEASAIFKPRGSAQTISKLIAQHKDLKSTIAELSLPSSEWKEHTGALERAQQEADAVTEQLAELRTALARLERLREAIPIVSERNNLLRQLQDMGKVVVLAPEFKTSRLDAQRTRTEAIKTKARIEGDLQRIEAEIDALDVPEGVLKEKDAINALHERLGGYRKAQQDKPTLATERDVLIKQVQNTLIELSGKDDLDQVAEHRLPIEEVSKIRRLGTRYDKLQSELDRSEKRKSGLDTRLAKAERDLEKSEPAPDVSELKAAVRRARRKGDPESQMAESCAKMQKTRSQAERGLKALPLWDGTLEQLEALSVPMPETTERYNELLAELEQKKGALDGLAADIDQNAEDRRHRINELQAAGEVPTESQLGEARAHRDTGWQLVRRAWLKSEDVAEDARLFDANADLPDAYEHSVQSADSVSDRLRKEADRVAELQQLADGLAGCDKKRKAVEADREKNNDDTARVTDEWHSLWRNIGISPLSPKEMKNWLTRHEKLVAHAATIREHEAEAAHLKAMIEAERETLDKCLEQIGEPPAGGEEGLANLLDRCEEAISRIEKAARARGKLEAKIEELGRDCHDAAEEHDAAERALAAWRKDWVQAAATLRMQENADPADAAAVLDRIQALTTNFDKAEEFRRRIEGIDDEAKRFNDSVADIIGRVAPGLGHLAAEQAVTELSAQLNAALSDEATLKQLARQRDEKTETLRQAELDIEQATGTLEGLCLKAGCEEPEDLEAVEERSEKARVLRAGIAQAEERIAAHSGGAGLDDFIREAEATDPDSLPAQIDELDRQMKEKDQQRTGLDQAIGSERQELNAMDGSAQAAEAAEAAQNSLAGIRANAERYAQLRIAGAALERAIERYRETNQGPILGRASQLFSRLTSGAFSALRTSLDEDDQPIIEGVRLSGETLTVEGMSNGTRDQLYLALRLASLEKHVRSSEPMPFIVDDVLVNFDNERSEATLKVLAELSRETQIIFFTHHLHLVDLARQAIPEDVLFVQELAAG